MFVAFRVTQALLVNKWYVVCGHDAGTRNLYPQYYEKRYSLPMYLEISLSRERITKETIAGTAASLQRYFVEARSRFQLFS